MPGKSIQEQQIERLKVRVKALEQELRVSKGDTSLTGSQESKIRADMGKRFRQIISDLKLALSKSALTAAQKEALTAAATAAARTAVVSAEPAPLLPPVASAAAAAAEAEVKPTVTDGVAIVPPSPTVSAVLSTVSIGTGTEAVQEVVSKAEYDGVYAELASTLALAEKYAEEISKYEDKESALLERVKFLEGGMDHLRKKQDEKDALMRKVVEEKDAALFAQKEAQGEAEAVRLEIGRAVEHFDAVSGVYRAAQAEIAELKQELINHDQDIARAREAITQRDQLQERISELLRQVQELQGEKGRFQIELEAADRRVRMVGASLQQMRSEKVSAEAQLAVALSELDEFQAKLAAMQAERDGAVRAREEIRHKASGEVAELNLELIEAQNKIRELAEQLSAIRATHVEHEPSSRDVAVQAAVRGKVVVLPKLEELRSVIAGNKDATDKMKAELAEKTREIQRLTDALQAVETRASKSELLAELAATRTEHLEVSLSDDSDHKRRHRRRDRSQHEQDALLMTVSAERDALTAALAEAESVAQRAKDDAKAARERAAAAEHERDIAIDDVAKRDAEAERDLRIARSQTVKGRKMAEQITALKGMVEELTHALEAARDQAASSELIAGIGGARAKSAEDSLADESWRADTADAAVKAMIGAQRKIIAERDALQAGIDAAAVLVGIEKTRADGLKEELVALRAQLAVMAEQVISTDAAATAVGKRAADTEAQAAAAIADSERQLAGAVVEMNRLIELIEKHYEAKHSSVVGDESSGRTQISELEDTNRRIMIEAHAAITAAHAQVAAARADAAQRAAAEAAAPRAVDERGAVPPGGVVDDDPSAARGRGELQVEGQVVPRPCGGGSPADTPVRGSGRMRERHAAAAQGGDWKELQAYNNDQFYMKKDGEKVIGKIDDSGSAKCKEALVLELFLNVYLSSCKPGGGAPVMSATGANKELISLFYAYGELLQAAGMPMELVLPKPEAQDLAAAKNKIGTLFTTTGSDEELGKKIVELYLTKNDSSELKKELSILILSILRQSHVDIEPVQAAQRVGVYSISKIANNAALRDLGVLENVEKLTDKITGINTFQEVIGTHLGVAPTPGGSPGAPAAPAAPVLRPF